jgi:hypothetical protein
VAFLGEICNPISPLPDITPEEYSLRLLKKVSISWYIRSDSDTLTHLQSQVYARLPRRAACEGDRTLSVWTPSIVTVILSSESSSPHLIIVCRVLKTGKSQRSSLWTSQVH